MELGREPAPLRIDAIVRVGRRLLAGQCFDNAVIEAFWGRMQVELLNTKKWSTTFELVVAMANWIDTFYNTDRVHSYIGNISPDQYETLWASTQPLQLQYPTAET